MKDLPPLQWLRSFEAAARRLSFTEAAKDLHITQSSVSQQIKLLEHRLGKALFVRQPRGLKLTEAGLLYLPTVQTAFSLLRGSTEEIADSAIQSLDLRCNWGFCVLWLVPRLGDFQRRYPEIQLNISTEPWPQGESSLRHGLDIQFGSGDWLGCEALKLTEDTCFPVAAPSLAAHLHSPEQLLQHPLIHVRGCREQWHHWLSFAGVNSELQAPTEHRSTTYIIAQQMASQGLGIALGHPSISDGSLENGSLVKPFDIALPMQDQYYLLNYRPMNSTETLFRDWLLESLAG